MLNGLATETVQKFSYLGSNISNQNLSNRNHKILNNSWFSHSFAYISLKKNISPQTVERFNCEMLNFLL